MQRFYISGPMKGHENFNYSRFGFVKQILEDHFPDAVIISPTEVGIRHGLMPGLSTSNEHYRADLKELCECTDIVMIGGWPASKGARLELKVALDLDMTVWFMNDKNELMNMTVGSKNSEKVG